MTYLRFLALLLTACYLTAGMAHVAELPNKIGLPAEDYLTVQQTYRGWNLFGIVLLAALASILSLIIVEWRAGRAIGLFVTALAFLSASMAVFFVWTEPANVATEYWTMLPENWREVRATWEYSHAAGAGFVLLAFSSLALAVSRGARSQQTG